MSRSPIPQLIEDFHQMTPEEQRCFLDLVDPQPEPQAAEKVATKKPAMTRRGGCAACDYTKPSPIHHKTTMTGYHVYQPAKSQRASNLAATLNKSLESQRRTATNGDSDDAKAEPTCDTCGNTAGYVDHFQPSPAYHPFTVKGVAQAAGAGD